MWVSVTRLSSTAACVKDCCQCVSVPLKEAMKAIETATWKLPERKSFLQHINKIFVLLLEKRLLYSLLIQSTLIVPL